MKNVLKVVSVLISIFIGLYVGFYLCLWGGIIGIYDQFTSDNGPQFLSTMFNIIRILSAAFFGWISFFISGFISWVFLGEK